MNESTLLQLGSTSPAVNLASLALRLAGLLAVIAQLVYEFLKAVPTPAATHDFELRLQSHLREMGRVIMEWTLNRIEPRAAETAPARITFDGQEHRRKSKSNRPKLGTLFGAVLVSRLLYEPLERGESSLRSSGRRRKRRREPRRSARGSSRGVVGNDGMENDAASTCIAETRGRSVRQLRAVCHRRIVSCRTAVLPRQDDQFA